MPACARVVTWVATWDPGRRMYTQRVRPWSDPDRQSHHKWALPPLPRCVACHLPAVAARHLTPTRVPSSSCRQGRCSTAARFSPSYQQQCAPLWRTPAGSRTMSSWCRKTHAVRRAAKAHHVRRSGRHSTGRHRLLQLRQRRRHKDTGACLRASLLRVPVSGRRAPAAVAFGVCVTLVNMHQSACTGAALPAHARGPLGRRRRCAHGIHHFLGHKGQVQECGHRRRGTCLCQRPRPTGAPHQRGRLPGGLPVPHSGRQCCGCHRIPGLHLDAVPRVQGASHAGPVPDSDVSKPLGACDWLVPRLERRHRQLLPAAQRKRLVPVQHAVEGPQHVAGRAHLADRAEGALPLP